MNAHAKCVENQLELKIRDKSFAQGNAGLKEDDKPRWVSTALCVRNVFSDTNIWLNHNACFVVPNHASKNMHSKTIKAERSGVSFWLEGLQGKNGIVNNREDEKRIINGFNCAAKKIHI